MTGAPTFGAVAPPPPGPPPGPAPPPGRRRRDRVGRQRRGLAHPRVGGRGAAAGVGGGLDADVQAVGADRAAGAAVGLDAVPAGGAERQRGGAVAHRGRGARRGGVDGLEAVGGGGDGRDHHPGERDEVGALLAVGARDADGQRLADADGRGRRRRRRDVARDGELEEAAVVEGVVGPQDPLGVVELDLAAADVGEGVVHEHAPVDVGPAVLGVGAEAVDVVVVEAREPLGVEVGALQAQALDRRAGGRRPRARVLMVVGAVAVVLLGVRGRADGVARRAHRTLEERLGGALDADADGRGGGLGRPRPDEGDQHGQQQRAHHRAAFFLVVLVVLGVARRSSVRVTVALVAPAGPRARTVRR
jgi:hypothetical protein